MTEYEIIILISEHSDRQWEIMQFWANITFGLVIVSHIASEKLNLFMVIFMSFLYVAFSLFTLSMLKLNSGASAGYIIDLQNLGKAGIQISQGTQSLINMNILGNNLFLIIITFVGAFIGAIIFFWYSYFTAKMQQNIKHNEMTLQERVTTSE